MIGRSDIKTELVAMLRLAWPLIIAQIAVMGQGVVEVMLAGHLDARVLGAVAIGANLVGVPLMAMIGTMYAVPASVAQLDGARKRHEVAALFRQAAMLGLAMGVLMLIVVRWGAPWLVTLVGVPEQLADDVRAFLHAVCFAMPAIGLFVACRGLSDGVSKPGASMVLSLCGLVLLLPVGYVLMYGKLGFPSLGAVGTGYAAVIVDWLQAFAFLAWIRFARRYDDIGWAIAGRRGPDFRAMAALLRLGVPMGINVLLEIAVFSSAALAIGRFGEIAAASHQVALNVAAFAFMVPLGLANAITVRVGGAAGRRDVAGARRAGLLGMSLVLVTQFVSSSIMLTWPGAIADLYTRDAAVIAGATVLLRIAGVFQLSDGIQVACNGALRGLKDTRVPMFMIMFAYWVVGMPLGLYLAFTQDLRAPGLWAGLTAGLTIAAILLFGRFVILTRGRDDPRGDRSERARESDVAVVR